MSVHLSVNWVISPLAGARVLAFGLRVVFTQSLSISLILKAQCIVVASVLNLHDGFNRMHFF